LPQTTRLPQILDTRQEALLTAWLAGIKQAGASREDLMSEAELRQQCSQLLQELKRATASGSIGDIHGEPFAGIRDILAGISRSRAIQGFTPTAVAGFVLSMKRPLALEVRQALAKTPEAALDEIAAVGELLDQLALFTTEVFQKSREEMIQKQQQDLLELSTPVVKLWDGVLALPLVGTLDSARTQVVMESLLLRIVETECEVAIIDITGVPTVDTLTAQHLIKTVTAARLMGADCIISGIRPQIAQTIVHLGVDLGTVVTKATLADAFKAALTRASMTVVRLKPGTAA
jgi:rsbT co-antagonist protein RsbR